jgi:hypothetical protein
MMVCFSFVGTVERRANLEVEMSAVPREGETITLPDLDATASYVRTVVWYPAGQPDDSRPFAYVVIGPSRVRLGTEGGLAR